MTEQPGYVQPFGGTESVTAELIAPIIDLEPIVKVLREIREALYSLERTLR